MSEYYSTQVEARPFRETARDWEGQVVNGEFRLRDFLGGSDHSAVFLTDYDNQNLQRAAIKLIPADSEGAELQLNRWEMAAGLSHPHLLSIYEMGRCQLGGVDLIYVVTEYAEEDLSQILPLRSLTPDETRGMLEAVLEALAYIHAEGFVHGRISPANIMANGDQLKLSIDSLSPAGEPPASLIRNPSRERPVALFPANDVWALGMLLAEVLTQHAPSCDSSGQAEPAVPETLPAPFFDIVRNCLRKDPCRRWTVSDIALGLRALPPREEQQSKQITEHPTEQKTDHPMPPSEIKSAKSRNVGWTLALALFLAAAVTVPKLIKHEQRPKPAASPLSATENPPEIAIHEQAPKASPPPAPARAAGNEKIVSPAHSPSDTANLSGSAGPAVAAALEPGVIHRVVPDVPAQARDTIRGTVRVIVRVDVDSLGEVKQAVLDTQGPSAYFAGLAVRAAQQWKFSPQNLGAQKFPDEWLLRFDFTTTGANAVAVRSGTPPHPPVSQ